MRLKRGAYGIELSLITRTILGAGCAESIMAKAVDELAHKTPGKKSIAIEAYARALRQVPSIIADNGGWCWAETFV